MAYKKKLYEEDIQVDINDLEVFPEELDFDEFNKVVAKSQITVATKDDEEDEDDELKLDIDIDDLIGEEDGEESEDKVEDVVEEKEDKDDVEEKEEKEEVVDEATKKTGKSILEMYEARKKRVINPLVESVLCDTTVDVIANALQSTLRAHGISKAQSFATLGMILDKMLHATEDDVVSNEFVADVVGELVDTDDLKSVIINAIEQAISGEDVQIVDIEKEVGEFPVTVDDVTDDEDREE